MNRKTFCKLFIEILFFVVLTGCINNNPPPPSVIHAEHYSTLDSDENRILPNFNKVLTVEDAVRIGLENNPTYEKAKLSLELAYNNLYQQLVTYLPDPDLSGNATISNASPSIDGSYQVGASLLLFNGLQREMNLLQKYELVKQSDYLLKAARLTLIYNIKNTYYLLARYGAEMDIESANAKFYKMMLDFQLYKRNLNLVTDDYVLNFETNYELAKSRLVQREILIRTYQYTLAALMGITTVEIPKDIRVMKIFEIEESHKIGFEPLGVEYYLDIAISQNPDLKQQRAALKAAKYQLYSSWGTFAPTIIGGVGQKWNIDGWNQWANNPKFGYGIDATWDLWNNERPFIIRGNMINVDIQELAVYEQWLTIVQNVRTFYIQLEANILRQQMLEKAYKAAIKQRKIVQEKYEMGVEDITRLNQVQTELLSAENLNVQAMTDILIAKAALDRACGIQVY